MCFNHARLGKEGAPVTNLVFKKKEGPVCNFKKLKNFFFFFKLFLMKTGVTRFNPTQPYLTH